MGLLLNMGLTFKICNIEIKLVYSFTDCSSNFHNVALLEWWRSGLYSWLWPWLWALFRICALHHSNVQPEHFRKALVEFHYIRHNNVWHKFVNLSFFAVTSIYEALWLTASSLICCYWASDYCLWPACEVLYQSQCDFWNARFTLILRWTDDRCQSLSAFV